MAMRMEATSMRTNLFFGLINTTRLSYPYDSNYNLVITKISLEQSRIEAKPDACSKCIATGVLVVLY